MPQTRALAITIISIAAGIAALIIAPIDWPTHWPLVLLYAALLVNTYFSVMHFSNIVPADIPSQRIIDGVLTVFYLALAATLGNALLFSLTLTIFFAISTLKYVAALTRIPRPERLYRKIEMNTLGTIGSALALGGTAFSGSFAATALWAIAFGVASAYLLFIKPLYADKEMHR